VKITAAGSRERTRLRDVSPQTGRQTPPNLSIDARERLREAGWPAMAFLERKLADDETNWWAPNAAAVEAMARSAGLEIVDHPAHELWICRPGSVFAHAAELAAAAGAPRDGEAVASPSPGSS